MPSDGCAKYENRERKKEIENKTSLNVLRTFEILAYFFDLSILHFFAKFFDKVSFDSGYFRE